MNAQPAADAVEETRNPVSKPRAIYTLVILILIGGFNYLDRLLLGLMAPLIRKDIIISDTTYGLISGFAFVLFYALLGVPIAALADRISRRNVIAVGFTVWTVMTMVTGMVTGALQLAVTRFLIGAGEACFSAPSNTMINDLFSARTRRRALSVFFAASSGISTIAFVPLVGLASAAYGWRATFVGAGLAGLALVALFMLTVREPQHREPAAKQAQAAKGRFFDFGFVTIPFVLLVCSSALNGAHLNASLAWSTIFLNRVHDLDVKEIATTLVPFRGVMSTIGILIGGYLTDRLSRTDARWRLWLPALACFLVTPSAVLFLFGESRWVWMTGYGLDSLLLLTHVAPVYALAMEVAGPKRRALALSVLMLGSMLVGSGMGPLMVGYLNDQMKSFGPEAIRYSLMVAALFPGLSAAMLVGAGYFIDRDRRRAAIA